MGKHLLWLTETYPPQRGGMAQSCDRLVDGLRQRGHRVDVVHFTAQRKRPEPVQQINGRYLPITFEESEAHTLNKAWPLVERLLGAPDALVAFGGNLPVWAGPAYAAWLGVPLITCLRGNDFDTGLFTPRKRDMLEAALRSSHTVCAVSQDKAWKVSRLYPEVNARFVPNGIVLDSWQPTPGEQAFSAKWRAENLDGRLCLGVFGQLKAKKGLTFLLDALQQHALGDKIHLLLVGDLAPELAERLADSTLAYTHLHFLDRFELLKYYGCCDGICIPSYYDGMPNVLLEAGALGIPVVASSVDGMRDVLEPVLPGLLFPVSDPHACRKVLHDWVSAGADERLAWGQLLKTHVQEHYTHTKELDHYEAIFETLAGDAAAGIARSMRQQ